MFLAKVVPSRASSSVAAQNSALPLSLRKLNSGPTPGYSILQVRIKYVR